MDQIEVQVQNTLGNWQTCTILTSNHPQQIKLALEQLKLQFPDQRVRAVAIDGSLVDMLG